MHSLSAETPAVAVSFMWDRAEHRRLVRDLNRYAKLPWVYRHGSAVMVGACALAVAVPAVSGDWNGLRSTLPWALILAGWWTLFLFGMPYLAARGYPKQHPCVSQPFRVALTDEGMRTTCAHSDVLAKWSGIRRAVETRDFFLFYVSDRAAHYLPTRALEGPDAVAHARDFILRHVPLRRADAGKR